MRLNARAVEPVHSFTEQEIQRGAAFGGEYIAMHAKAVGTKMAVSPSSLCEKAVCLLSMEDNPACFPDGYHVHDSMVEVCSKLFMLLDDDRINAQVRKQLLAHLTQDIESRRVYDLLRQFGVERHLKIKSLRQARRTLKDSPAMPFPDMLAKIKVVRGQPCGRALPQEVIEAIHKVFKYMSTPVSWKCECSLALNCVKMKF